MLSRKQKNASNYGLLLYKNSDCEWLRVQWKSYDKEVQVSIEKFYETSYNKTDVSVFSLTDFTFKVYE